MGIKITTPERPTRPARFRMGLSVAAVIGAIWAAQGCRSPTIEAGVSSLRGPARVTAQSAASPAPASERHEEAFLADVPRSTAVFVGRLVQAGPPPATWSGRAASTQWLRYAVVRSLRGDVQGPEATVHALIVRGGPLVRDDRPGLRDDYLVLGGEYVVLAGDPIPGLGPALRGSSGLARVSPGLLERLAQVLGL